MKFPNFKPVTSFGLSKGPERKAGIAAAALPKMRTPSGLAQSQMKPPSIKVSSMIKVSSATARGFVCQALGRAKVGAEHHGGFEMGGGSLEDGSPLGAALDRMIRKDSAVSSPEVMGGQDSYQQFHGHAGDGQLGRP